MVSSSERATVAKSSRREEGDVSPMGRWGVKLESRKRSMFMSPARAGHHSSGVAVAWAVELVSQLVLLRARFDIGRVPPSAEE